MGFFFPAPSPRARATLLAVPACLCTTSELFNTVTTTMEVVAYDRLVADFEALECVRGRLQRRRAGVGEPPDYASGALAAEEAAERYLTKMPAAQQTREAVTACWRALSEHEHFCQLTTPEKLQMINQRPLQPVAVHLMIEDCHRRFRDDEIVEELITLLETHVRIKEEGSESALGRSRDRGERRMKLFLCVLRPE